jgi:exopolyphosphatase / guanosine-5'-triphosphate,3'-diphosphate pyrophosphatase
MAEMLALVDLGSNATRFILARINPGVEFRVLREERAQTRLAGGPRGRLSPEAVDETVAAVGAFLRRTRTIPDLRVNAIATSAVRDAPNSGVLLAALRRQEDLDVRILAPDEEARLGAIAATWSLPLPSCLVFDLGGGSLQLARAHAGEIHPFGSFPLGAVRTTERFLRHDPPTSTEIATLRGEVWRLLLPVLDRAEPQTPLVGLGGTARTLARIYRDAGKGARASVHGLRLPRREVTLVRERLQGLPSLDRLMPGLKPERADIVLAGSIVIEEVMALTRGDTVIVCDRSVRHGFLIHETFLRPRTSHTVASLSRS